MNYNDLKQYVLFAVVTILIGLLVCEFICYFYPDMKEIHTDDSKYLCIFVLGITGLILKYLLNMKYIKEKFNMYDQIDNLDNRNYEILKKNEDEYLSDLEIGQSSPDNLEKGYIGYDSDMNGGDMSDINMNGVYMDNSDIYNNDMN